MDGFYVYITTIWESRKKELLINIVIEDGSWNNLILVVAWKN